MIQNNSNMCGTTCERIFAVAGHRGLPSKNRQTKAEVAKRQTAKVTCECGAVTSKVNLPAHRRSKKHLQRMETGVWHAWNKGMKCKYGPRTKKYKPRADIGTTRRTYNGVECLTKEERAQKTRALAKSTVTCVGCGTKVLYNSMWSHLRSAKHRDLMAALPPQPKHFIKKRKYKLIILD